MNTTALMLAALFLAGAVSVAVSAPPDNQTDLLLVANKTDHTLSLIDPMGGVQIAAIPEDETTGHEVAASLDGQLAFVPIYGSGGVGSPGTDGSLIRVMDLQQHKVKQTIDLRKPLRPHCAVAASDGFLYVTTELGNSVTVLDPKSFEILGEVPTGMPESHMLAITRDARKAYTSNVGSGTISVLDLKGRKLIQVIKVCEKAQRLSLSQDDSLLFTADQKQPRLAVIDTRTDKLSRWVELPGIAYGTAVTTDGRFLLVALIKLSQVAVLNLASMTVTRTLDVPKAPQEVLVRPDGQVAYVSCDKSGQVAELDLKAWRVKRLLKAGQGADGLAWAARRAPKRPAGT